jgi:uncharacterized protein (TIGR02328 family)
MRLWHQSLIPYLDRQRILGQHRECSALRGNGWGKKHSTVDYVFTYSPQRLVAYHFLIMDEMEKRGYKVDQLWRNPEYRGKKCSPYNFNVTGVIACRNGVLIYPEHNEIYLNECLENLKQKGIIININ